MYTVKQVAEMAGVSVRTLHHYHDIGLLFPVQIGENGYRYYGREELLRLQQILIYREMDIPLSEMGLLLDALEYDRLSTLQRQRERVASQSARYAEMLKTIDHTIADLKGESAMKDAELYNGIVDPQKQAAFEIWLEKEHGSAIRERIETSNKKMHGQSDAGRRAMMAQLRDIEQNLADAMGRNIPPQSTSLDPILQQHWAWVQSAWNKPAPLAAYANLADTYLAHPDFVVRYETIRNGFSTFLTTAMKSWVARQE